MTAPRRDPLRQAAEAWVQSHARELHQDLDTRDASNLVYWAFVDGARWMSAEAAKLASAQIPYTYLGQAGVMDCGCGASIAESIRALAGGEGQKD